MQKHEHADVRRKMANCNVPPRRSTSVTRMRLPRVCFAFVGALPFCKFLDPG